MRGRTLALSQKELQGVSVISSCVKGDMACARAAELLSLSVRQVKRLKKRFREQGEAALAHANRGRPSPRRLPSRVRQAVVRLARTTYAGFNDHHLCEKLGEVEGLSLSRETLRRLLRQAALGSPRKRRAPSHRQRRLRSAQLGELVQLDGSPHDWLQGRGPRLTALGMQDDATGKILAAQFFPSETAFGYLSLLRQLLQRHGVPLAFYGDRSGIFVRNDDAWTVQEQLAGKRQPPPVRPRSRSTRHHFHRRPVPTGQGPRRAPLGRAAGSPQQRTAPGCRRCFGSRQCRSAPLPRRLQPPLRPAAACDSYRLASGSAKSGSHRLLRS